VQLKSGGYIVINQTEALVAIDVNSGRATRDRHIEDTALRTNLEAADEIARQLRLRDLAGLIVIDFIDMESAKHDGMVERRMKDALKQDRARIQVGRISHFGLLEMSRQRLRPSIAEQTFVACPHCQGRGLVRSVESSALQVLRAIEEEGAKRRAAEICVHVASPVALWLLNRKRERLAEIEQRFGMAVMFEPDDTLMGPAVRIERTRAAEPGAIPSAPSALRMDYAPQPAAAEAEADDEETEAADEAPRRRDADAPRRADVDAPRRADADADTPRRPGEEERAETAEEGERRRRRRRRRRGGRREDGREDTPGQEGDLEAGAEGETDAEPGDTPETEAAAESAPPPAEGDDAADGGLDADGRRRRRGRRGGRRRREDGTSPDAAEPTADAAEAAPAPAPRPARYTGPTPADPFAGQIDDIFEAMEAAEAAAERAANARPARATPAPAEGVVAVEAAASLTVVEAVEPAAAPSQDAPVPRQPAILDSTPAPMPEAPAPMAAPVETTPVDVATDVPRVEVAAAAAHIEATAAAAPAEARTDATPPEPPAQAAPPAPVAPAEPVVGAPVQPVVLGTGAEAALPKRQGWWKR
jgi:ribonuclease E